MVESSLDSTGRRNRNIKDANLFEALECPAASHRLCLDLARSRRRNCHLGGSTTRRKQTQALCTTDTILLEHPGSQSKSSSKASGDVTTPKIICIGGLANLAPATR